MHSALEDRIPDLLETILAVVGAEVQAGNYFLFNSLAKLVIELKSACEASVF